MLPEAASIEGESSYAVIAVSSGATANEKRVVAGEKDVGLGLGPDASEIVAMLLHRTKAKQPDVILVNKIGIAGAGRRKIDDLVERERSLRDQRSRVEKLRNIFRQVLRFRIRLSPGWIGNLDDDLARVGSNRDPEESVWRFQQEFFMQT